MKPNGKPNGNENEYDESFSLKKDIFGDIIKPSSIEKGELIDIFGESNKLVSRKLRVPKNIRVLDDTKYYPISEERQLRSRVVSFNNAKGGPGKTTNAYQFCLFCARKGLNVIALDLDNQHNLTTTMGIEDSSPIDRLDDLFISQEPHYLYDLSKIITYDGLRAIRTNNDKVGNIAVIPSSREIEENIKQFIRKYWDENGGRYSSYMENYNTPEKFFQKFVWKYKQFFDLIVIDTSPTLGTMSNNLAASVVDEIVCPIDGFEAIQNLPALLNWLKVRTSMANKPSPGFHMVMSKYYTNGRLAELPKEAYTGTNEVWKVAHEVFEPFVCQMGVRERKRIKNARFVNRKSEFTSVCEELYHRIFEEPKNDIFAYIQQHPDAMTDFQSKMIELDKAMRLRECCVKNVCSPSYIGGNFILFDKKKKGA